MEKFINWLYDHPHEYMRFAVLWMLAAVLSPWRIPMLLLLFAWHSLLLFLIRERK